MNNDLTLGTPSVPVGDESQPNFSFQIRQLVLVNYPYQPQLRHSGQQQE